MAPATAGARSLCELFADTVRRFPLRPAVDIPPSAERPERKVVSYQQLAQAAAGIAERLRRVASRDDLVAVLLPRTGFELYAAQLGTLSAGAAFVCLDPKFPDDYVAKLLADARPKAVVTTGEGLACLARIDWKQGPVIDVGALAPASTSGSEPAGGPVQPGDLAYVIYTSGTTGEPKGVMLEHRGIVNLVSSDIEEFGLTEHDRCAQGSSAAYDSSLEEAWLALAVGATVVVLDDETIRLGPDLVGWLRDERITVFCPPPTLLRMMACPSPSEALPALRLLYVGGEALGDDIVEAWAPGRRMNNGYGPTECTVTVVRADVVAGQPVTIGHPVPGNQAWVLDAALEQVAEGADGELCIGGVGLARGYLNRPEATREKFVEHPQLGRIYRTGDRVRRRADGQLVFGGRIDEQIKLRGYRIELGAVERAVSALPGIAAAACAVRVVGGGEALVAFILPDESAAPHAPDALGPNALDPELLRALLLASLPSAMVPSRFVVVDALPTTLGGKLDRRALPSLQEVASTPMAAPIFDDALRTRIAQAMATALGASRPVAADDDFFVDLGGDSLSAVAVVCDLRRDAAYASVTTRDLYECRSLQKLAERIEGASSGDAAPEPPVQPAVPKNEVSEGRVGLTTAVQGLGLLAEVGLGSVLGYALVFLLLPRLLGPLGVVAAALAMPLLLRLLRLALGIVALGFAVAAKWLLIGRYRPRCEPVWGGFYLRHWLVLRVAGLIPWTLLSGTVFFNLALRALGAKIGRRVHIHRGVNLQRGGWDLIELGDDVTIAQEATLEVGELESGHLLFDRIVIGAGATLDIRANLGRGTTVGEGAYVDALSWLPPGTVIPAGERYSGVPAVRVGDAPEPPPVDASDAPEHAELSEWQYGLALLAAKELLGWIRWLPTVGALLLLGFWAELDLAQIYAWLATPSFSLAWVGVVVAALFVVTPLGLALRALALRNIAPVPAGVIRRFSLAYIPVWLRAAELEAAGRWLTGTLYWPMWLRLAGMRIGELSEVSTIIDVLPERVQIGARSFFADGIYLGCPEVHRGTVRIADTRLGDDTFLGNHVVVPGGGSFPDRYFVGVCTIADSAIAREDSAWFGHPRLELPHRNVVAADDETIFSPSWPRLVSRYFWETLRFGVPLLPLVVSYAWYAGVAALLRQGSWALAALGIAGLSLASLGVMCAALLALKWFLLGRMKPGQHPLWSCWCSRWDFLYFAWQQWARPILALLEGSLYLTVYLRAMGLEIGKRVVLGAGFAQVVDPDMLHFGDGATVATLFQAHSFEDRVLKLDHVRVEAGATAGHGAVLFYGAKIGEGAWVMPSTVVMKNEEIAAGARAVGVPSRTLQR